MTRAQSAFLLALPLVLGIAGFLTAPSAFGDSADTSATRVVAAQFSDPSYDSLWVDVGGQVAPELISVSALLRAAELPIKALR